MSRLPAIAQDELSDIEVESRKTALLFRNAGLACIANMVNAVLLAGVNLSLNAHLLPTLIWCALVFIIATGRYWLSVHFQRTAPGLQESKVWRQRYIRLTILAATAWGAAAVLFMWDAPVSAQLFTGLVLAGNVAGAVPILAPVNLAFRSYAFLVLVPTVVVLLVQADSPLDWAFTAMTALFLVMVKISASYLHETLDTSIRLELEQHHLALHLEEARRLAEAGHRTKSEFLANMSHEIRTPMNGVLGMATLLGMTRLDAQQTHYLKVLTTSGQSLLTLINDVLDLSKAEEGKIIVETLPMQIEELVSTACAPLVSEAHRKNLTLSTQIAADVPATLQGDPIRLRQILTNLIANAVKFTDHGQVRVEVTVQSLQPRHVTLRFSVQDTGIGIPADKHESIFESFSQADGSITRRFGGTGLGLSICRHLVLLMGGHIRVESQPGQGSTFHVSVRLEKPNNPDPSGGQAACI